MEGTPARLQQTPNLAQGPPLRGRQHPRGRGGARDNQRRWDGEILPALLDQFDDPIAQLSADGAYDSHSCYQAIEARGAKAAIPPRCDAVPWPVTDQTPYAAQRNAALETIESQGRTAWKHLVGYHRRSLAETAMYRLKTLFGAGLKARRFGSQVAEVYARVAAMNTMTRLGMPESLRKFCTLEFERIKI